MMITLLKKSDYQQSLWKNGRGKTSQIAIDPPNSEVSKNNFLWRISSATVASADPFSPFMGYERQLVVWQGAGLKLNKTSLLPYSPITFSGAIDIQCELIGSDPVIDLGVIYDKEKISAQLSVQNYFSNSTINLGAGIHFLFLAEGSECSINDFTMQKGDTLKIVDQKILHLQHGTNSSFTFFLISLTSTTP